MAISTVKVSYGESGGGGELGEIDLEVIWMLVFLRLNCLWILSGRYLTALGSDNFPCMLELGIYTGGIKVFQVDYSVGRLEEV